MHKTKTNRWQIIDVLRGLALIAMVIYHASWNLDYFGLTALGVFYNEGWKYFAFGIAGSFLLLSGISLQLAHKSSSSPKKYFRRIIRIAIAALLISGVTFFVFPNEFIYFGILHHIALAAILIYPLLRLPAIALSLIALLIFATEPYLAFNFANPRWFSWTGIAAFPSPSNDFVPLFPWLGVLLFGAALGKLMLKPSIANTLQKMKYRQARPIAFLGRHTLIIYLLHQPILFGLSYLLSQALAP